MVYALLLEKRGCQTKLYFGSATKSQLGLYARLQEYDRGSHWPRLVQHAVDQGYAISHRGLLCWAPLPTAGQVPSARVRFVAVGAVFCSMFFAAAETKLGALWTVFLPWRREIVAWLPLCTHTPLLERPQGVHDMTPEQLKAYNEERRRRVKEQMAVNNKRHEDKSRDNDIEGYLAQKRRERFVWDHASKDRVHGTAAGVRARTRTSKKHEWHNLQRRSCACHGPREHLASKAHKEQLRLAASGQAKPISIKTMRSRRHVAKNKANKTHYYAIYDTAFNIKDHLAQHLKHQETPQESRCYKRIPRLLTNSNQFYPT